ncbi:hypothetical protein P5673_013968 [Acropora cervicornis]|uniref:Uncharacterized protein n=1 Tax=Acropora cervicornis TaxID=6130 RepID=A0AAD9QL61_ACRCE|nr:hypothetical protein P5673_013968 [Acropora cervicornis]
MFNEAENYNNKTEHMKQTHVLAANNKRKQNIRQTNKYPSYDKKSESDAQKRNISLKESKKNPLSHSTKGQNDKRCPRKERREQTSKAVKFKSLEKADMLAWSDWLRCKVCSKSENMCFETVPHGTLGKSRVTWLSQNQNGVYML